ncbi:MAG TPA: 3-isopropylmalate dehydratase small subunit [Acidobacteriota bacterium]|nr:3-isopropylmalate dehydratase small subunit [Acidobacteriota bacterium]
MQAFTRYTAQVAPLDRINVDTDQIIPKQFLKRIERTGFGRFLFYDWRFDEDDRPRPDFVLNKPFYKDAGILLARANFGCGSSREHAPWSLGDYGFRVIVAPSFADIFYNNCFKNGMLPVVLEEEQIERLFEKTRSHEERADAASDGHRGYRLTVDLEKCLVSDEEGLQWSFEVDPFRRQCLLEGLDDIALTLQHEDKISAYEAARE